MIILDLETSGLNCKEDKIIEFAAVKIDENLNEIERLNFFVNPEIQVSNEVLKITWIKQEILDKSHTFQEKIPEIEKFLDWDRTIIWHNIQFDIWFLQEWWFLKKNNFLDTFVLSSIFFEKQDSYALEVLSDKFKIEHEFKHRAIWDVLANLDLLRKIIWKIKTVNWKFYELLEKNIWEKRNNLKYSSFIWDIKSWLIWEEIDEFCDKNKSGQTQGLPVQDENKNVGANPCVCPDKNQCVYSNENQNEIFEFSTKQKLFQKIENFFHQKEKNLVIIPSFLRNILFEKYENFPEINIIYWEKFHWSEKKFYELISDENFFEHTKNFETREFFALKILLAISENLELNLKNIHISYDEYDIWSKIIDDEKWVFIWEKNLIEFKDFAELKNKNVGIDWIDPIKNLKKLFIEPEINFEDRTNFASLNYITDKIPEEEKNILKEKFWELKKYFLEENFENFSEEEKNKINEKTFWKYWLTIEINKEKILQWDWEFFKNFEDKSSDENLAFSTEWRKKTEEKWKKFLFDLKDFWEEFKKILSDKKNFSWMEKNLEKFLNWENSKNFYKFIKISENNISLSAQKIDLISEFEEDFTESSFWFFWWWLKLLENWKTPENKNFNFIKKIYWLNNFEFSNEEFEEKNIKYFYPKDPYAPWPKNPEFWNFLLNQISEICWEKFNNSENKENIWIFVNNKRDLENIYKHLLENYPDFEIFAEWLSGWRNKIIHKISEAEKFILIAQNSFFEKLFTDSEKNIDYLIFTKFPFDAPNGIAKLREWFYFWKSWNNFNTYALPKSLLKTKQIILSSWAENVFFIDKRVWEQAWAKNYCNL